jgi:hypothetical protein
MSDLLATVVGGVFIIAACIGIAYIRAEFAEDAEEEQERLQIERWTKSSGPGMPLRRSQVRIVRDGKKPPVYDPADRFRRVDGAGFPDEAA